ncbi:MAG: 2-amino-4-hydroxy-6-hydroxymethyldihydropteridine diphosphokinase [Candidatus Omnitrophica bacterium]|nr:2-amino-4-hydroxy-6-hydroxymethyldihydropteridine diphosphokinase [Candidatus Omnitrophota bacterium]
MVTCYIGIGSNLGERRFNLQMAIKELKKMFATRVTGISSLIETAPVGGPAGQGMYLNGVVEIETEMSPYQLLKELQRIESFLGRVRTVQDAPRVIDLDILLYGDYCINEEALCIPHPRMFERDFVLVPLKEIAPRVLEKLLKERPVEIKKVKTPVKIRKKAKKKEKKQRPQLKKRGKKK